MLNNHFNGFKTPFFMLRAFCYFCFFATMAFATPKEELISDPKVETQEQSHSPLLEVLIWPFSKVFQPLLNVAIYPLSAPLRYAFEHRVIDKGINFFSFGESKNIFAYPTFNLKPGTTTQIGGTYRHRRVFFPEDYLVVNASLYANSDIRTNIRYSKGRFLNTRFLFGLKFGVHANRDDSFIIPMTYESFVQTDTSMYVEARLSRVIPGLQKWSFGLFLDQSYHNSDIPDTQDSVLIEHPSYSVYDRGVYQDFFTNKVKAQIQYDNLDFPFIPTKGTRIIWSYSHFFISDYKNLAFEVPEKNKKNHNFSIFEFVFQHYFMLGTSKRYQLNTQEIRDLRKKFVDFTWDESIRLWNPEKVMGMLFNRKVIAVQYRFKHMLEAEKGGAPHMAFPVLNSRFPLRGYSSALAAPSIMGLSLEYRWPVDRYVDGVFFNEYAIFTDHLDHWKKSSLRQSWGLGVRIRSPSMFFFRTSVGFHGLHGVEVVITIAPEFY